MNPSTRVDDGREVAAAQPVAEARARIARRVADRERDRAGSRRRSREPILTGNAVGLDLLSQPHMNRTAHVR